MTGWVGAIAQGMDANWEICKANGLWGTPSGSGGAVRRGDDLFLWKSGEGWLAHLRATTDAWAPRDVTEVPWPDPRRYRYLFRVDVVAEPPEVIAMAGADATAMAGPQATIRLGQFPSIDGPAVAALSRLFGEGESALEAAVTELLVATGAEVPPSSDERDFAQRMIAIRRGQQGFRQGLLRAFDGACCISGSRVEAVLEAAHIRPYLGAGSHAAGNGLLLRADLHTLFDLHLITVLPLGTVRTAPDLDGSDYEDYDERLIRQPTDLTHRPNPRALEEHNEACGWLT